jgi:hypothetical protein
MDFAAALAHARAAIAAGKLRLTGHVVSDKMPILELTAKDVENVIATAEHGRLDTPASERADGSEKWKLCGFPLSRQEMHTAVVDLKLDGRAIVVTIHPYTEEDSE